MSSPGTHIRHEPTHVTAFGSQRRGGAAVPAIGLILSAALALGARVRLEQAHASLPSPERPPIYLPEVGYVRLITGGYDTVAAKVLWFETVSYFGKQFAAHKDYRWLGQMCDLVTKLDPRALHAAQFCGTLLPWMAHDPERGVAVLTTVIDANPLQWRPLYLRGFIEWYFLEDFERARTDIVRASKLPNAADFLASLAARMVAQEHGTKMARQFLEETLNTTTDEAVRKALMQKLQVAYLTESLEAIEQARDGFRDQNGRFPADLGELITGGFLSRIPPEPFGGSFFIDRDSGEVRTTSKRKRLEFYGRTARTSPLAAEAAHE